MATALGPLYRNFHFLLSYFALIASYLLFSKMTHCVVDAIQWNLRLYSEKYRNEICKTLYNLTSQLSNLYNTITLHGVLYLMYILPQRVFYPSFLINFKLTAKKVATLQHFRHALGFAQVFLLICHPGLPFSVTFLNYGRYPN